jgi:hypothetical protein
LYQGMASAVPQLGQQKPWALALIERVAQAQGLKPDLFRAPFGTTKVMP